MRCKSALLLLLTSCTPMEREIVEEVIHEASVAEQAIEKDMFNTDTLPHPNQTNELPERIPNVTQKNSSQVRRRDEKGRKGIQKESSNGKKEQRSGKSESLRS